MNKLRTPILSLFCAIGLMASPLVDFANSPATQTENVVVVSNDAYSYVKKYMEGFKNGNFVLKTTSTDGVKAIIGQHFTEGETSITVSKSFTGFTFEAVWTMNEGVLDYFDLNTFYDDDAHDAAARDGKETIELLTKIFGTPTEDTDGFYDWKYNDLLISCNLFEDGYSIYVDPESGSSKDELTCVGDFYNLKKDLQEKFIANMKNGSIKIGTTTKSQMASITGDGESFYKEYDGLWATATYVYDEAGKLSSLTIDYFYDCSGALILLDIDKGDITTLINSELGVDGFKDTDSIDATVRWNVNGQSLRQEGYDDGYAILFDK